ncbi:hypothetical protein CHS0354_036947 [Potamilus streckersoni]|uniref:Uncharacterized protein n=1 Tax=Potamilus streckersoni TaxID=2493646 RepID=A0AAE0TBF7_9BIVA|nr:hypothetical protein CHS0354_036947 [Potamilus streckersoni]
MHQFEKDSLLVVEQDKSHKTLSVCSEQVHRISPLDEQTRPSSSSSFVTRPSMNDFSKCHLCGIEMWRGSLPDLYRTREEIVISDTAISKSNSGYLSGSEMSSAYSLWKRPNNHKLIGRGKLDVPNALKRREMHRDCGCLTRESQRKCNG